MICRKTTEYKNFPLPAPLPVMPPSPFSSTAHLEFGICIVRQALHGILCSCQLTRQVQQQSHNLLQVVDVGVELVTLTGVLALGIHCLAHLHNTANTHLYSTAQHTRTYATWQTIPAISQQYHTSLLISCLYFSFFFFFSNFFFVHDSVAPDKLFFFI